MYALNSALNLALVIYAQPIYVGYKTISGKKINESLSAYAFVTVFLIFLTNLPLIFNSRDMHM